MLINILLFLVAIYALFTFTLAGIWLKKVTFGKRFMRKVPKDTTISVLIAARNEALNIPYLLRDLAKQRYPQTLLEVIIINDHSTDDTVFQIENLRNELGFPVHIIHLEEFDVRGKKNAIKIGVQKAQGELIVCTDADCRVGEFWLLGMQQLYKGRNAKLISAGVTFIPNGRLWTVLQSIEFASLVGSGACAMMIGKPNMCNGANIAYPKAVFEEVNGFDGNEHIASGDDEFLMHKITEKYPNQIVFAHYQPNIVFTQSQENLRTFVQQRKRWASKWNHYKDWKVTFLAIAIFTLNFGMLLSPILWLKDDLTTSQFMVLWLVRCLPEYLFLAPVLSFFKKSSYIKYIPLVQVLYPFYVVFFGISAWKKGYVWKGRRHF